MSAPPAAPVVEDDPIVETYSVFIKPPLPPQRRLLVLQHPNNQSDHPSTLRAPPITDLRLKTSSGMLEADVPLDYNTAYDRHKGMVWGSALQKSTTAKTSLGLSGGFGVGGAPARTRGRGAAAAGDDVEGGDWNEAVRGERVLKVQTLGGLSTENKDARYLVAVFQGKNVHLTPVSSLAHLRPQLHHIDASADQERIARATSNAASSGKEPAAKAIHMTIKSSTDGDVVTETMADRLRGVQLEPWKKMEYVEEYDLDAWDMYKQSLLLRTEDDQPAPVADMEGKGKEPAAEEDEGVGNAGASDLDERVPGLGTDWGEDELLRGISGIKRDDKKPGEEAVTEPSGAAKKVILQKKAQAAVKPEATSPVRTRTTRARRPAPAAARRGGRSAGPSTAMDVDA